MKIKKAVIACAGKGTRFLPITRSFPKEMLPIIDKPALEFLIDEAEASGIKDILIIISPSKDVIKDYFKGNEELATELYSKGKDALAKMCEPKQSINLEYTIQFQSNGTADAVLCAEEFCQREPFVLLWGDDLIRSKTPVIKQLGDVFERVQKNILGCQKVDDKDIDKYGIIKPLLNSLNITRNTTWGGVLMQVEKIIEKPALGTPCGNLASIGRYVLLPQIFDVARTIGKADNGELQLPDAINILAQNNDVFAYEFEGIRYDVGDKFGALRAAIEYGLLHDEIKDKLKEYLSTLKVEN